VQVHLQAEVSLAALSHFENQIQAKGQTDLSEKKEAGRNAQPVLTVKPKAAHLRENHSVTVNHPTKNVMTIFLQEESHLRFVEKILPDHVKLLIENPTVKEANALAIVSKNLLEKGMKVLLREDRTAIEEEASEKTKEVLIHVEDLLMVTEKIHRHHRAHAKQHLENRITKEAKGSKNLTPEEMKEVLNLADVLLTETGKIPHHRAHARLLIEDRIVKEAKARERVLKSPT
jgi:hypothetical protein